MNAPTVFSHMPTDPPPVPTSPPAPVTGLCPMCWFAGPLVDGRVCGHRQLRVNRTGQHACDEICPGSGLVPEPVTYDPVWLPGLGLRHLMDLSGRRVLCGREAGPRRWLSAPTTSAPIRDCGACARRAAP